MKYSFYYDKYSKKSVSELIMRERFFKPKFYFNEKKVVAFSLKCKITFND